MKADFIDQKPPSSEHIFTSESLKNKEGQTTRKDCTENEKDFRIYYHGHLIFTKKKKTCRNQRSSTGDMRLWLSRDRRMNAKKPSWQQKDVFYFQHFHSSSSLHNPLVPCQQSSSCTASTVLEFSLVSSSFG